MGEAGAQDAVKEATTLTCRADKSKNMTVVALREWMKRKVLQVLAIKALKYRSNVQG